MEKPAFAVITVPRRTVYLYDTIRSLRSTGFFEEPKNLPLRLVTTAPGATYLDEFRGRAEFMIDELSPPEAQKVTFPLEAGQAVNAPAQRNLCANHRRAILALNACDADGIVIFEDDIRFSEGWLCRLGKTLKDVERAHGDWWVMTLFAMFSDAPLMAFQSGKLWDYDRRRPFWGTQAIVYPKKVALAFEESIMSRCILEYRLPIDELIGAWSQEHQVPIIATAPSLVQHVGQISAGCSHGGQTTAGFVESIQESDVDSGGVK
jgi:hypothetical protein